MTLRPPKTKPLAYILMIICVFAFIGCHRYYMPVKVNSPTVQAKEDSLKKLSEENRYFILRTGTHSYALNNLVLDESKLAITADISPVSPRHKLYIQNKNGKYKYSKGRKQEVVLKEVHLFTRDTSRIDTSNQYTVLLSNIEKIEVIEFDKKQTNRSYIRGTVGITMGAVLAVVVIAAIVEANEPPPPPPPSGSCPYISTYDGEKFLLQGEIYSMAIYPSLQKEDFLPLQMKPMKDEWCLKISNELNEIQYTDFANLLVAEHSKEVRMLIDPQGKMHSIKAPEQPLSAFLNNSKDVTQELKFEDYKSCLFNDGNELQNRQDLYLKFKNNMKNTKGKLVLKVRSSSWFLYVYDEFTKGFGNYYNKWVKQQHKEPAEKLEKWMDEQAIALTISVKTAEGWKEVNKINGVGPLLNREIVIPLNLPASDLAEIKISSGYMFWELDYAGIDYSEDAEFTVHKIKPYQAINEKGLNVLPQLELADKKFMIQPNTGDSAMLNYKMSLPQQGRVQTFFLHTSGYYDHPRDPKGFPKVAFLKSFEQPGALSAFSKQKFFEVWNNLATTKN